jgi:hypothetical protein
MVCIFPPICYPHLWVIYCYIVFQALSNGEVAYTHFTRVKRFPTLGDLKHAFERRVAFHLWVHFATLHLFITTLIFLMFAL